ncbi:MAG: tRNA 2-selenouridine synthase [Akkermansiaceae bacterium]|jgi:tRNA 2-selenouridine synthase
MDLPESITPPFSLADFPDIIDVRSPAEFEEDHIPGAYNLPVLTDEERHEVGALNAENPYQARRLGATLITKNIHHHLATTLADHPTTFAPLIYCWRGNLRSNSMAVIFRAIGWRSRVIQGGYKAWRKYLMADMEATISPPKPELIVLGGLTGCGKTRLLHELDRQGAQILDLEGLANHRGSILGNAPDSPQPNQKRFESSLWTAFRNFDPERPVFTEAESNRIGRLQCPPPLWKRLGEGRMILIDLPLPERAKLLAEDYEHFIENPDSLKETLNGLRRLRGNEQVDTWHQQIDTRDWDAFLQSILVDHYDLCYRRPGSEDSVYPEPEVTFQPASSSTADFQKAAADLIARHS